MRWVLMNNDADNCNADAENGDGSDTQVARQKTDGE